MSGLESVSAATHQPTDTVLDSTKDQHAARMARKAEMHQSNLLKRSTVNGLIADLFTGHEEAFDDYVNLHAAYVRDEVIKLIFMKAELDGVPLDYDAVEVCASAYLARVSIQRASVARRMEEAAVESQGADGEKKEAAQKVIQVPQPLTTSSEEETAVGAVVSHKESMKAQRIEQRHTADVIITELFSGHESVFDDYRDVNAPFVRDEVIDIVLMKAQLEDIDVDADIVRVAVTSYLAGIGIAKGLRRYQQEQQDQQNSSS